MATAGDVASRGAAPPLTAAGGPAEAAHAVANARFAINIFFTLATPFGAEFSAYFYYILEISAKLVNINIRGF